LRLLASPFDQGFKPWSNGQDRTGRDGTGQDNDNDSELTSAVMNKYSKGKKHSTLEG